MIETHGLTLKLPADNEPGWLQHEHTRRQLWTGFYGDQPNGIVAVMTILLDLAAEPSRGEAIKILEGLNRAEVEEIIKRVCLPPEVDPKV